MRIGWFCGVQDWAFKNLAEHLVTEMKDDVHFFNAIGDVNVLMSADQLKMSNKRLVKKYTGHLDNTILHLDGHRWVGK